MGYALLIAVIGSAAALSASSRAAEVPRVPWRDDLSWLAATSLATQRGQPILLDFTATWCGPCKLLDVMVFTEEPVIAALADVLTLQVDLDRPGDDDLPRRFDVTAVPTLIWCLPDGREFDRFSGYVSSSRFSAIVADWRRGIDIGTGLQRALAARPESPDLLLEAARRQRRAGRDRDAVVSLHRLLNLAAVADTGVVGDARRELAALAAGVTP